MCSLSTMLVMQVSPVACSICGTASCSAWCNVHPSSLVLTGECIGRPGHSLTPATLQMKKGASPRSRHTRRALASRPRGRIGCEEWGRLGADKLEGDQGAAKPRRQTPSQLHRMAKHAPC